MDQTLNYFQTGMWMTVVMSSPPLIVAAICGVSVALIQAVTQIQDQSLSYIVTIAAVSLSLAVCARWYGDELIRLFNLAFTLMPDIGR